MPFNYKQWQARVAARSDISGMLTHLTKPSVSCVGKSQEEINLLATKNLISILNDSVLKGSTTTKGFIVGNTPAVCFQDTPIYGLVQNIAHEEDRRSKNPEEKYRYCGAGLAFSKWKVYTGGGRPAFYERTEIAKKILPVNEHWRIVNLELTIGTDAAIDWTHEREWRVPNDYEFDRKQAHVLLYDRPCWDYFLENCSNEILKEIFGVTMLRAVMM